MSEYFFYLEPSASLLISLVYNRIVCPGGCEHGTFLRTGRDILPEVWNQSQLKSISRLALPTRTENSICFVRISLPSLKLH